MARPARKAVQMKAQYDAARILLGQKDYREALRIYLDIVHQFPKDGRAYQGLSQCYFGLRRFDDALSASNKAIQLDENLAMPHVVLAYVYHYWSDYDKALAEAHRAYAL